MDFHSKDIPNSYWTRAGRGKRNYNRTENRDCLLSLVYVCGHVYTQTDMKTAWICAYVYICIYRTVCIHLYNCTYIEVYTDSVAVPECYVVLKVCGNKLYLYLFCAVSLLRHSVFPYAMIKKGVLL